MGGAQEAMFEGVDVRDVRPYLIVDDADAAIEFYRSVYGATELERHTTPSGGVGHAKVRIGSTIVEIGEHPSATGRVREAVPRVGLRLYVANANETYERAIGSGATGEAPTERLVGSRSATIYDPFGLTWWIVEKLA